MSKTTTNSTQPNNSKLSVQVQDDLTVQVIPSNEYEFLMTTKEVANGYGTSEYAIRISKMRHEAELFEGKHFVTAKDFAVTKCNGDLNLPHNAVLWTKRGIIRLGFFIKSERAKLFRDWAEELIINLDELSQGQELIPQALPPKRHHNRLTKDRLVGILADVARIEDKEIRLSLIKKLGV